MTDIVVALVAVAAFLLSLYNAYALRRDAAVQAERWDEEKEQQEKEKRPSLKVSWEEHKLSEEDLFHTVRSCRIVNDGQVPVEVRSLHLGFGDKQRLPMPPMDKEDSETIEKLYDNEYPVTKPFAPRLIHPNTSIRFATYSGYVERVIKMSGHVGDVKYEVIVVDSLGNEFSAFARKYVVEPEPDP